MWEMELNNKNADNKKNAKVVEPVGSEQNWYTKANQYWSVILL